MSPIDPIAQTNPALNGPGEGISSSAIPLHKAQWRQISSYGHVSEHFLESRRLLRKAADKVETLSFLKPWLAALPQRCEVPAGDYHFAAAFRLGGEALTLEVPYLPHDQTQVMAEHLGLETPGMAAESLAEGNASLWPALLRLRVLHHAWSTELRMRKNYLELMLAISPEAWLLNPEPVPPGGLIPGFNVPDWLDLRSRENLALWSAASSFSEAGRPWSELEQALAGFPSSLHVVGRQKTLPTRSRLLALYERRNANMELRSCYLSEEGRDGSASTLRKVDLG